jgi:hypothetical protein
MKELASPNSTLYTLHPTPGMRDAPKAFGGGMKEPAPPNPTLYSLLPTPYSLLPIPFRFQKEKIKLQAE